MCLEGRSGGGSVCFVVSCTGTREHARPYLIGFLIVFEEKNKK